MRHGAWLVVGMTAGAVMRWTFRPARSGGRAVAVWVDTPHKFTLD